MIICTADIHGSHEWDRLLKLQPYITADDTIIIAGDAGLVWGRYDNITIQRLKKEIPCKILCVDGNHENFDRIRSHPLVEIYGGEAYKITNQIYYLDRGEIFTIEDKKIFVFGGARSIDKNLRVEGETWWPQEIPTSEELAYGYAMLEQNIDSIDYVITHEWPQSLINIYRKNYSNMLHEDYSLPSHLDNMYQLVRSGKKFKTWIAGHMHEDIAYDKFAGLYHNFLELK